MIYLKFMIQKSDDSLIKMVCTDSYNVVRDDKGLRVYHQDGMWERVGKDDWLNCFVMSETGQTIDKVSIGHSV